MAHLRGANRFTTSAAAQLVARAGWPPFSLAGALRKKLLQSIANPSTDTGS
jgi:hypothetical protein